MKRKLIIAAIIIAVLLATHLATQKIDVRGFVMHLHGA